MLGQLSKSLPSFIAFTMRMREIIFDWHEAEQFVLLHIFDCDLTIAGPENNFFRAWRRSIMCSSVIKWFST